MPADILQFLARLGLAKHRIAVGEEKPRVEAAEYRGRGDRAANIGQRSEGGADTAFGVSGFDRAETMPRRAVDSAATANHDADLLPGLAQCGAGAAHQTWRQMLSATFDVPWPLVLGIDRAAGKDIDPRHELDMTRPPPGQQ